MVVGQRVSWGAGPAILPPRIFPWSAVKNKINLDGVVDPGGSMFEAKFMLPWSFSKEAMAEKDMPRLQRNMWVTKSPSAACTSSPWAGNG
jgi:hypothetical protein